MSTCYYMVCDKHLERTAACTRISIGIGQHPLQDSLITLGPFIVSHHGCPVRIVWEHEDDAFNERFTDWTAENVYEMAGKFRRATGGDE